MSGIQVHTSDPISPAKATKATAITPRTAYSLTQSTPSQPTITHSVTSSTHTPAEPEQAILAPTRTSTQPTEYGPPVPQPGAIPHPPPPSTTAKANLPPPPKAGEVLQPPSYYVLSQTTGPNVSQPCPPQMSQTPLQAQPNHVGISPHPTTSTNSLSQQSMKWPTTLPASDGPSATQGSLEHPPGYVQNQFATEMTAEQRFTNLQQDQRDGSSGPSEPVLGYVPTRSRAGSSMSAVTGGEIWEGAKKYLGQVGGKVSEVEGKTWDWINGKH